MYWEREEDFRKVLVLYTGGTIGMVENEEGVYAPEENAFKLKVRQQAELHDECLARKLFEGDVPEECFVLNKVTPDSPQIIYAIKEYEPLMDSSNMSIEDWKRIAKDIEKEYLNFDSFVVLHGTDTLCYTAAALSFMLQDLQKSVVLTGSQIPIFQPHTDAIDNFLSALVFSATYHIPEVCVFFANQLFRGNRTLKSSSDLLNAFSSPNYPCLGTVDVRYTVSREYIWRPEHAAIELTVRTKLNPNVGILNIFPTITAEMLQGFIGTDYCPPKMQGVVFQSYGVGNIPSHNSKLIRVLREAVQKGILIVNVTQCVQGSVSAKYETGKALEDIGIIPGYDMTASAAMAKLSYVLGMDALSLDEKKKLMQTNIRGELTPPRQC